MNNFLVRTGTAVVLVVVVAGCVLLSQWSFLALALAICGGGLWEFLNLAAKADARSARKVADPVENVDAVLHVENSDSEITVADVFTDTRSKEIRPLRVATVLAGMVTVALVFLTCAGYMNGRWLALIAPLVIALPVAELYRRKESPFANVSIAWSGLVYVALPLGPLCALALRGGEYNPLIVLVIVGIVAVNDIFAYITGVLLGRHRLMERISPKKSWEGFFGGLVFAMGAAVLCGLLAGDMVLGGAIETGNSAMTAMANDAMQGSLTSNLFVWAGLGAVIVAGAVLGDLVESMFKRSAGVKDSGNLLPGHGGILDRIDALLAAVPLAYAYITLLNL